MFKEKKLNRHLNKLHFDELRKKSRALECCNIFHWANGKKELISENHTRGPEQTKMNEKKKSVTYELRRKKNEKAVIISDGNSLN